ncbi:serine hydrolase domain-containing protein [Nocardiopsis ganjiahuensis]|uniref:serine hydrolase domain-containing protein n=1 Tax=Nocardiopsis ganjiahuensis TaxID=239984 RepID=UPI00034691BB|nr:serine hydrolase domain-containing protein [Nocardiopsis ganjiahuensis]
MRVDGYAHDGYEGVRRVFQDLVAEGRETGAGLSVWRDGREVVRLGGGWTGSERRRPWTHDTLVQPYSVSKPFAALAALVAVRDGALGLDEPLARHWRGYGDRGKEHTTLRHVLTHRAGQPRFPESAAGLGALDDAGLRNSLVAAEPEYAPGTRMGEHALTHGHLIDGVLRAATGSTLGEVFNEVVRPALGLDAWFGVPEPELARVADLEHAHPGWARQQPAAPWLTVPEGPLDTGAVNSRAWRRSVFGGVNLHTSATAVAGFLSRATDPDGPLRALLGPELHEEYLAPQATGHDDVFGTELTWTLGFLRDDAKIAKGGIGGSAAWWSLRHGHACAYLTRRLDDHSRVARIAEALGDDLSVMPMRGQRSPSSS